MPLCLLLYCCAVRQYALTVAHSHCYWLFCALMPLCLLLCCCVMLQYALTAGNGQSWMASGQSHAVEPGRLCQVVDIVPAVAGLQLQPAGAVQPRDVTVLVQIDSGAGPIVAVPTVTSIVHVVNAGVIYDVQVQHMPVRLGWAMTVPAAQGMEFERVLLDLPNAGWLPGGGYTGIGRVKGRLQDGLSIRGGGARVNRDDFNCNMEVLQWFVDILDNFC